MTRGARWVRTAIGTVLGLKLLALAPFLAGLATGEDSQATAVGVPRFAVAIEQEGSEGRPERLSGKGPEPKQPVQIPGGEPRDMFTTGSGGVRELSEAVRRKSEEIGRREAELAQREKALAAAAEDLQKKIAHLESLAMTPAGTEEPAMAELAKIYGAMKAEEAAPLLDRLGNETVQAIFAHMKQRQISAVLPLMDRDKAVALTELLGGRRRNEERTDAGGG